jgi:hypothetical protein
MALKVAVTVNGTEFTCTAPYLLAVVWQLEENQQKCC